MSNITLILLFTTFLAFLTFPQLTKPFVLILSPVVVIIEFTNRFLNKAVRQSFIIISIIPIIFGFLVTMPVHYLSKKREISIVPRAIRRLIGTDHLHRVRKDMLGILSAAEKSQNEEGLEGLDELRKTRKSQYRPIELLLTIVFGAAVFMIPDAFTYTILGLNLNILIPLYVLLLAPAVVLRITLLDVLAFSSPDEVYKSEEITSKAAVAWQEAITQVSAVSFLTVFAGLFAKYDNDVYEKAIEASDLKINQNRGLLSAVIEVVFK